MRELTLDEMKKVSGGVDYSNFSRTFVFDKPLRKKSFLNFTSCKINFIEENG